MHNAAFAALGLNWRYLAFEVDPKNLRAAIEGARAMNFVGLNLTVPHKLLAVDMVDELDASAKAWGAVNTIKFENGRAIGFNTDADGLEISLRMDLAVELRGAKVLMLGAGGAAHAAALKLAREKVAELFLVNRTASKAEEIAVEIKKFSLKQTRAVYDMIYKPAETKLLVAAKAAGCKTANGIGMLVHQGANAFKLWTGQPAPVAVMRRAVEGSVYGV